jgi:creatinine amidohydrolase
LARSAGEQAGLNVSRCLGSLREYTREGAFHNDPTPARKQTCTGGARFNTFVMNGDSGNVHGIQAVTQEIYVQRGVLIPSLYLWQIGHRLLPTILGPDKAKMVSGHGADPLTSIALKLFPNLIRSDLMPTSRSEPQVLGLPVSGFATVGFDGIDVSVPIESNEIAPNGIFGGDPRLSSVETGTALVDRLVEIGSAFIEHFSSQPTQSTVQA